MYHTLTKLARTLFGTATTRKTQPVGSRFRPRLECLEERAVPAVYNVTNGNDAGVGSLRAAITAANGTIGVQDEIHIAPNLTVSLMSELPAISGDLIVVGGGQSNTVIRRAAAAPAFRIFTIIAGSDVQMQTLTIQGGDATQYAGEKDGGGILNRGNLLMWRVTVQDSLAVNGGGIAHRGFGSLEIIGNSLISQNTAQANGGGLDYTSISGKLFMHNSTFSNNLADGQGGGMYYWGSVNTGRSIDRSFFTNNLASNGGGMYIEGDLLINNTTIQGNSADGAFGSGGGIYIKRGTVEINNSVFLENEALSKGGGVWLENTANLSVIASIFSGNTAFTGKSLCIQIGAGYTFASNILDWPEVWVP